MLYALEDGKLTSAKNAKKGKDYKCGSCGEKVLFRKCKHKVNHFTHLSGNTHYDCENKMSEYHIFVTSLAPKECREIKLTSPDTKKWRVADILLGSTVVEIQHSKLPAKTFEDRLKHYLSLGKLLAFCFDLQEQKAKGKIKYLGDGVYEWKSPYTLFKDIDIIDLWNRFGLYFDLDGRSFRRVVEVAVDNDGNQTFKRFKLSSSSIKYREKGSLEESDFFTELLKDYPRVGISVEVKRRKYTNKSVCTDVKIDKSIEEIVSSIFNKEDTYVLYHKTSAKETDRVLFDGSHVKKAVDWNYIETVSNNDIEIFTITPGELEKSGFQDYTSILDAVKDHDFRHRRYMRAVREG